MERRRLKDKADRKIEWENILARLAENLSDFEHGMGITEEKRKKILKERADGLAREAGKDTAAEGSLPVLEFLLAQEHYAIETAYVREVYPMKDLTVLPCTPPFMVGVIDIRGEVLPVIDIRKLLDLPEVGITNFNKVVIVKRDVMELGIITDEIVGVRDVSNKDMQSTFSSLAGIRTEYLKAVTGERLVLLDIEKLLADRRVVVHEEVELQ